MNKPTHRASELAELFSVAKKLSFYERELVSVTTLKTFYARDMYNKSILHLGTAAKLVSKEGHVEGLVDVGILAATARIIIELYKAFRYLLEKGISTSEFEFRLSVYNLHHKYEIRRILAKFNLGKDTDDEVFLKFAEQNTIAVLKQNQVFRALNKKLQKDLLKGKRPLFGRYDSSNRNIPLPKNIEEGLYKLLSNSIHPSYLGLINYIYPTDKSHLDFWSLLFLSVEAIIIYSASIIKEYSRLRNRLSTCLSKEEKRYIKHLASKNKIDDWIQYRKWYEKSRQFLSIQRSDM